MYLKRELQKIISCPFVDFDKLEKIFDQADFEEILKQYPVIWNEIQENMTLLDKAMQKDRALSIFKYERNLSDSKIIEIAQILDVYDDHKSVDQLYNDLEDLAFPIPPIPHILQESFDSVLKHFGIRN